MESAVARRQTGPWDCLRARIYYHPGQWRQLWKSSVAVGGLIRLLRASLLSSRTDLSRNCCRERTGKRAFRALSALKECPSCCSHLGRRRQLFSRRVRFPVGSGIGSFSMWNCVFQRLFEPSYSFNIVDSHRSLLCLLLMPTLRLLECQGIHLMLYLQNRFSSEDHCPLQFLLLLHHLKIV